MNTPEVSDMHGTIAHDVALGISYDDGRTREPEQIVGKVYDPPLAQAGRYEVSIDENSATEGHKRVFSEADLDTSKLRAGSRVRFYLHVRSYLVARGLGEVIERRYPEGARVLVRETWDEPASTDGVNATYALPIAR